MDKSSIVQEIFTRVRTSKNADFSIWRIGLTHDPTERRAQHEAAGEDTRHWLQWVADSLNDAQGIETLFINTYGMKGGTGGDLSPRRRTVYVYIF